VLKAIREFFNQNIGGSAAATGTDHRIQLATAALLIEVSSLDTHIQQGEHKAVLDSLRSKFGLADLLYVPHAQYITTKLRARDTAR
jgi:uncharacterized tellurite resistance protein B-like protein